MSDSGKKKVGIIACSGEEMPEGTVTRLAALKVLESLRPHETVTICLPLFLAGGAGDRAFARFHPTIAVDGCEMRCAAHGTELYSGKPAVGIVVRDNLNADRASLGSARKLNENGMQLVHEVADQIAHHVDQLRNLKHERKASPSTEGIELVTRQETATPRAACSCGSGIPVQTIRVAGREVALIALPLIFAQFHEAGKRPDDSTKSELMGAVRIYNPIPDEEETAYTQAIMQEYAAFCCRSN